MLPHIRNLEEFLIADLGQEMIVYDISREERHTLYPVAAFIFQLCDGKTTPQEMAARLQQEMNIRFAEQVTWIALEELEQSGLLRHKLDRPEHLDITQTRSMS